jgi:quinol monooxygenase YgiN
MNALEEYPSEPLSEAVARELSAPLVLQLFEHWESATALEAHFATPHFLAFSEVLLRASDGAAEFTRFEVATRRRSD